MRPHPGAWSTRGLPVEPVQVIPLLLAATRDVLADHPGIDPAQFDARVVDALRRVFPASSVEGYEHLIDVEPRGRAAHDLRSRSAGTRACRGAGLRSPDCALVCAITERVAALFTAKA